MNIEKVWHYSRYNQLLALASLTRLVRTRSKEYCAALYILSENKELFDIAKAYVTEEEIQFDAISDEAGKQNLGSSACVAIDAAQRLFYAPEEKAIDWFSCAELDAHTLQIVLDALNVCIIPGLIPTCNEHGEMILKINL